MAGYSPHAGLGHSGLPGISTSWYINLQKNGTFLPLPRFDPPNSTGSLVFFGVFLAAVWFHDVLV
jgi:hypothetical protein